MLIREDNSTILSILPFVLDISSTNPEASIIFITKLKAVY